jgi:GNAT superfamily N-acetyltransferase
VGEPLGLQVLLRTLGGAVRPVELEDRTVVRCGERPDHVAGNAVHLHAPCGPDGLSAAIADADERFHGPARVVVPLGDDGPAALLDVATRAGRAAEVVHVVAHEDPAGWAEGTATRADLELGRPADPRAWHGVQVLHRHARTGDDRGERDELLAWWVGGLQDLVGTGRGRVLVARRFGTPVGAGALVWDPRPDVGPDHAGLAVVTDHVVHPAHRGLGVARSLAAGLVATHLADFPASYVTAVLPEALVARAAAAGWATLDRLLVVA